MRAGWAAGVQKLGRKGGDPHILTKMNPTPTCTSGPCTRSPVFWFKCLGEWILQCAVSGLVTPAPTLTQLSPEAPEDGKGAGSFDGFPEAGSCGAEGRTDRGAEDRLLRAGLAWRGSAGKSSLRLVEFGFVSPSELQTSNTSIFMEIN